MFKRIVDRRKVMQMKRIRAKDLAHNIIIRLLLTTTIVIQKQNVIQKS